MGDGIGQFNEAPLIEEKHESSMRLLSPPAASSASQVLWRPGAHRAVPAMGQTLGEARRRAYRCSQLPFASHEIL